MGYWTEFKGDIQFEKRLTKSRVNEINNLDCAWKIRVDSDVDILYAENGKHTEFIEQLEMLNTKYFKKWNVKPAGRVRWFGEDDEDCGIIYMTQGVIQVGTYHMVWEQCSKHPDSEGVRCDKCSEKDDGIYSII